MSNEHLNDIIAGVYWKAFEEGRLLGSKKTPVSKDFDLSKLVINAAVKKIRSTIKTAAAERTMRG